MEQLAVFITVYDRLEYLENQLKQLLNQNNKRFTLYVVNNSEHELEVPQAEHVFNMHNEKSIYGRFFAIQEVHKKHEIILNLDDDEILPNVLTDYAYRQYDANVIKSFWAFRIAHDYWNRKRLRGAEKGHYAGTGGLLAPSKLFSLPELYQAPEEYWIIDDLWLSHCVHAHTNYSIQSFNVPIKFIEDHKATYKSIKELKSQFTKEYILPYI
jgi:glycosyltransferase involved in cell wall biosynthesis